MKTVIWQAPGGMEFEWDPAKAKANLRVRRVTFAFAARVFLDSNGIERPDEGEHGGEERWLVIGRVEEFVLLVVCVYRSERIRIISARKATHNEVIEYWNGQVST
jgi:uncharacterized DUF497 family protein